MTSKLCTPSTVLPESAVSPWPSREVGSGRPDPRDYAHDAYGSRIYDGASAFAGTPSLIYDDANRLVEVRDPAASFATIGTYTYDAFGRRVKKVASGKTILFFYDSEGHLIEEIEKISGASNDEARFYVFLEDELVGIVDQTQEAGTAASLAPFVDLDDVAPPLLVFALALIAGTGVAVVTRRVPDGIATTTSGAALILLCASGVGAPRFSWVHVDPIETPLAVTDTPASGSAVAVWRAKYEPFGEALVDEDPDANAAAFTLSVRLPGQHEDAETGWHYNFYRTYDPETGRYLEADPVGVYANPNPFAYAGGDPLQYSDPLGLVEKNYFKPSEPQYGFAGDIPSGKPEYGFAGHGNPLGFEDPEGRTVTPEELAEAIRSDPDWDGRPVRLYSCNTGNSWSGLPSAAQRVADALGVMVFGPDNYVWLGTAPPFTAPPSGPWQPGLGPGATPDRGNPGRWRVFLPGPS